MALKHTAHSRNNIRNREDPPAPADGAANNAKANTAKNTTIASTANNTTIASTANNAKKNNKKSNDRATNVVGGVYGQIVQLKTSPYNVTRCDQVVMFDAQTLVEKDDYSTRKDAFFTINAYMVNMFESQDSNKLLESINISHIKEVPGELLGAINCYLFTDTINGRSIEMCFKTRRELDDIVMAYKKLMECRFGKEVEEYDPTIVNKILALGCNGIQVTEGVEFDLPEIREAIKTELIKNGVLYTD